MSWNTDPARAKRIKRLRDLGFDIFPDFPAATDDDLEYAEFEFQVYTRNAQTLARVVEGALKPAESHVCDDLKELARGHAPGSPWNQQWEWCLMRWEGHLNPTEEGSTPGEAPYLCPVVIVRTSTRNPGGGAPTEHTPCGDVDRPNVWSISSSDETRYFFALDCSGMFVIKGDDPALASPGYEKPDDHIESPSWLWEQPRSFAQVQKYEQEGNIPDRWGFVIQPWRYCEFLPCMLGEEYLIKGSPQWRSIFRTVRAVTDTESNGYVDRIQGYDRGNMSLPLFQYTAPDPDENVELGAFLAWIQKFDLDLWGRFTQMGLTHRGDSWTDAGAWGPRYECHSGALLDKVGAMKTKIGLNSTKPTAVQELYLRRPHFQYRVAMLCRTEQSLREAMWRLSVHRLRNLAWTEVDSLTEGTNSVPAALLSRKYLGKVLTSERSLALALRIHVKGPAKIKSRVRAVISNAWIAAVRSKQGRPEAEMQAEFEQQFCQAIDAQQTQGWLKASSIEKVLVWPRKFHRFAMRLKADQLDPETQAVEPPPLSVLPYSSPFFLDGRFVDPVDEVEGYSVDDPDKKHPVSSTRDAALSRTTDFAALGVGFGSPVATAFSPKRESDHDLQHASREALAALTSAFVLHEGQAKPNPKPLTLRPHIGRSQRWARRQIAQMQRDKFASALRCGARADVAPSPDQALWRLDLDGMTNGQQVHVLDWRGGQVASEVLATVDTTAKTIRSLGNATNCSTSDPANFGIGAGALERKTFGVFQATMGLLGLQHVDTFEVNMKGGPTLTLASLRQPFKAKLDEMGSNWGFYVEYLAWRHSTYQPDREGWRDGPFGRHLAPLGLDAWLQRSKASGEGFLSEAWPADAVEAGATTPTPLEPALRIAPCRWDPRLKRAEFAPGDLAAAMLTWPSLHRLRRMMREDADARRALFDVWRMGLRSALKMTSPTLQSAFGRDVAVWNLLQTPACLSVLALWRQEDPDSLLAHLGKSNTDLPKKLTAAWIAAYSDYASWQPSVEIEFFWEVVVASLPNKHARTRARLEVLKPAQVPPARVYVPALGDLVDLSGLDDVPAPTVGASTYAPVLLGPGNDVRLGLLIAEATAVVPADAALGVAALDAPLALMAAARTEYWVSGLVPVLSSAGAIPLMLAQPVKVALGSKPGTQESINLRWSKDVPAKPTTFDVVNLDGEFELEADVSAWLGDLSEVAGLVLQVKATNGSGTWDITFELQLLFRGWLLEPLRVRASIGQVGNLALNGSALVWRVPMRILGTSAFPLSLDPDGDLVLTIGLDNALQPVVRVEIEVNELKLNLGSPVAALSLRGQGMQKLSVKADLMTGKVAASLPDRIAVRLALLLAARTDEFVRLVPTRGGTAGQPMETPFLEIDLGDFDVTSMDAALRYVDLTAPLRPAVPAAILARPGVPVPYVDRSSSLLDIAQEWITGLTQDIGLKPVGNLTVDVNDQRTLLEAKVDVELALGTAGTGTVRLIIDCPLHEGMLDLSRAGFALRDAELRFDIDVVQRSMSLGAAARVLLPARISASLDLIGDADRDVLTLAPAGAEQDLLQFSVPAEGGFLFDIRTFSVGRGGLSLDATVHAGSLQLGESLPSLAPDFTVERAADGVGRLVVTRGRLTNASLRARARLRLFDDADGLLTVRIFNEGDGIGVLAELDTGVGRTFHLRAIYLQVVVDSIRLRLGWSAAKGWTASGGITGSALFVPEGALAGRLAEYADLFDGTSVHFENLDLSDLGKTPVRVEVTPRTFDVAKVFTVTWRGFELGAIAKIGELSSLRLLGDIAFKVKVPNLRTELTLGDIRIRQVSRFSLVPEIRVSSIGIKVALDGGFSFRGRIVEFNNDQEYGFGGEVSLESSLIAGIDVLIKLTRVYDANKQNPEPSIVVYGETQRDDHLGYGFFLRRVGLGVAVRQNLRAFSDGEGLTIAGRIDRALQNPIGLPYPGSLEAWAPRHSSQPGPANLLAGYGLVSFGLLPMDKDHPFVGSLVVAIDDTLDIVAGINGWFFASPNNAKEDEFLRRPALRGALGLSPREQILYGRFMTLKNPKFGKTAEDNKVAELLSAALAALVLPAAFYADPRGAIVEIAHPRQARFDLQLGPARGVAEAGFRFGYYRGTAVVGLNLAVSAWIGGSFSGDLGFANVELRASASFQLQASFAGAITTSGRMYVLTELALSAALEISAHIWKIIRVSGWGFSFSVTLFDVSGSVGLSATAMLDTAIVPSGIGFNGTVQVSIHIAGFGISARIRIGASEGRIDEARRTIAELVPPIEQLVGQSATRLRNASAAALAAPAMEVVAAASLVNEQGAQAHQSLLESVDAATPAQAGAADQQSGQPASGPFRTMTLAMASPKIWRYFVSRVGDQLRVVLFADGEEPGGGYPRQSFDPNTTTYTPRKHVVWLNEDAKSRFAGVVGRKDSKELQQNGSLELMEEANVVLLDRQWMVDHQCTAARDLLVGDMLAGLEPNPPIDALEEVVDPRTILPVSGDFDDPAVLVVRGRRSTRFRRRHSEDGEPTYDDHLAAAAVQGSSGVAPAPDGDSTSSPGEVLSQLLNMARDASVNANEDVSRLAPDGNAPNPHFFASRLGLVLEFNDPPTSGAGGVLEQRLGQGIEALLDLEHHADDALTMFGSPVAAPSENCLPAVDPKESIQIVPGFDFQSTGEVGLAWSVVRTRRNGERVIRGPANHAGIGSFRVQRRHAMARGIEEVPPTLLRPAWIRYSNGTRMFAVRPQFQHVDSRLPLQGAGQLEYTIEALATDDRTVLARTTMRVGYRPFVRTFTVANSQVLLRVPATSSPMSPPSKLRVELLVAVSAESIEGMDEVFKDVPARLRLYRRRAVPPQLGRYGDGTDVELSMSWEEAFSSISGMSLQIPKPDQSRQASLEDFKDGDRVDGLRWLPVDVGGEEPGKASTRVFRASVDIDAQTATGSWDRLLGSGEMAAEFFVCVDGSASSAELPTPLLRSRTALAGKSDLKRAVTSFTEGTEVAALERMPVAAGAERTPEWANPDTMEFRGETWLENGAASVRLRGAVPLPPQGEHPFGPVIGMRLWCVETMGGVVMARPEPWSDVLIHSEPMFRSLPRSVTVRASTRLVQPAPDWRIEDHRLAVTPPGVASRPHFSIIKLAAGSKAILHASLAGWLDELSALAPRRRIRVHLDEPMATAPPGSGANRLLETLARYGPSEDWFGWRLLEAIGASATVWVESDDDRLDPAEWMNSGSRENVGVVTFSRLAPGQRPGKREFWLYGIRILCMPLLRELGALEDKTATAQQVASRGHWGAALDLAQQGANDQSAGGRYVQEVFDRAGQFIDFLPVGGSEQRTLGLWHCNQGVIGKDDQVQDKSPENAARPQVLPLVDGQVNFFHALKPDYAKSLRVAVEVVRRYDLQAPSRPREVLEANARTVDVPRTLPLPKEEWAVQIDGASGAVTGVVAVHPAQRTSLYRIDLWRHVQFVGQRVDLQRRVSERYRTGWQAIFDRAHGTPMAPGSGFDQEAHEASWLVDPPRPEQGLEHWSLDKARARRIDRGFDRYEYRHLPPGYAYSITVRSQAGVRLSELGNKTAGAANASAPNEAGAALEPMFTRAHDLRYACPEMESSISEHGALLWSAPLVRGIDALDERVRAHWTARDETWTGSADWAAEMPILQLPDPLAVYVLAAVERDDGQVIRKKFELLHVRMEPPGWRSRLLVAPYTEVDVRITQVAEGERAGRLAVGTEIRLDAPELAWLRAGLMDPSSGWSLVLEVERDGQRYTAAQRGDRA